MLCAHPHRVHIFAYDRRLQQKQQLISALPQIESVPEHLRTFLLAYYAYIVFRAHTHTHMHTQRNTERNTHTHNTKEKERKISCTLSHMHTCIHAHSRVYTSKRQSRTRFNATAWRSAGCFSKILISGYLYTFCDMYVHVCISVRRTYEYTYVVRLRNTYVGTLLWLIIPNRFYLYRPREQKILRVLPKHINTQTHKHTHTYKHTHTPEMPRK